MRIGTVTYHRSHNYGAFLQAFALASFLNEEVGINTEIIDFNMKLAEKRYIHQIFRPNVFNSFDGFKRYRMFNKSCKFLPLSKARLVSDDTEEFVDFVKDKYDIIITGSDEVWRFGSRGFPNPYWLPGNLGAVKLAYAVSSRTEFSKLGDEKVEQIKELVNDFEYVGTRDNATFDAVSGCIADKGKLYKNCDPVFLYDFKQSAERGKSILKNRFKINIDKPTIGLMLGQKKLGIDILELLKDTYGDKYNFVSLYFDHSGLPFCSNLDPFEWIDVISALDFFVTTYFHGTCFAIKSNTPFFTVECRKNEDNKGKSYDLLSEMSLIDCYSTKNDSELKKRITSSIDSRLGKDVDYSLLCRKQKEKSKTFVDVLLKLEEKIDNE